MGMTVSNKWNNYAEMTLILFQFCEETLFDVIMDEEEEESRVKEE